MSPPRLLLSSRHLRSSPAPRARAASDSADFSAYQRKLGFRQFIPLLPSAAFAAVLVLSPGLRGRGAMEAAAGFERFSKMNIFERLLCGFSNYFAFSFFFSLITAAVFLVLLGASVYEAFGGSRKIKKIISVFAIFASALCVGVNAAYIIIRRTTPDKGFEKMFKSGNYLPLELAVIALCFVFLFSLFILIAALIKRTKSSGSPSVCCSAPPSAAPQCSDSLRPSTPPVSACFTTPRCSHSSPAQRCILHFPIAKRKNSRDMQSRQPHLFSILSIVSPTHSLRYP